MKCPQTKFHPDNISHVKVLGKKKSIFIIRSKFIVKSKFSHSRVFCLL